jgi:Tol biopolymer transport system component
VISPDGTRAVYSSNLPDRPGGAPGLRLAAVDLASGARQVLATAATLQSAGARLDVLAPLNWSPDGQWLALLVGGSNSYNARVYLMPSSGGEPRPAQTALADNWVANTIGFSGDSQYLAYTTRGSPDSIDMLEVMALAGGPGGKSVALIDLPSDVSAAWSPRGHQLALASPDGVYVMDPANGATQWVAGGDCRGVGWFAK